MFRSTVLMTFAAPAVVLAIAPAPLAGQHAAPEQLGQPTAVVVSGPEVGTEAPDFLLSWAGRDGLGPIDRPFTLRAHRGKVVVLLFYPKDFTPTCTVEMASFGDRYDELFGPGVVVAGINADSLETHARFAARLNLPFPLLTDPGQRVSRLYGSADRDGYNRRTVYVIGPDGKVAYRDVRFNPLDPRAYDELRRAVQAARAGV
ncbi:MAG TPA: peroxiredoxin [Gemmatimonadales bacterium]|nr:peroxiredoxin [Gemmatimonadales bacterium]